MITQLKFHNFRVLQDATLPLGRVTVIIGPNGSGKSTALEGLRILAQRTSKPTEDFASVEAVGDDAFVSIAVEAESPAERETFHVQPYQRPVIDEPSLPKGHSDLWNALASARVYSFSPAEIAKPCALVKTLEMGETGSNLASVLTTLQDHFPEIFEAVNIELPRWMPESDRIYLDTVQTQRSFGLRSASGKHRIPAARLSHGNLIVVALLVLSRLPNPPSIIGLEEIDRSIHPRLLRQVHDAVNRLAFPKDHGEDRKPVQVILTTHSPFFIDLFRDSPEDIVIAEKTGLTAAFHRLMDMPHAEEILGSAPPLGDLWYSGILGGVPVGSGS